MSSGDELPPTDLDACEREPLAFSGRIQDVGALLATPAGSTVVAHASANLERWFAPPAAGARTDLDEFFRDDCAYFAHRRRAIFGDRHFVIRGVVTNLGVEGDLLLSESAAHHIYEFEAHAPPETAEAAAAEGPAVTVDGEALPASVPVEATLRRIHGITAYPKIMLYRFLDDGTGEVAAELSDQQLDAYQGLRFPASDIPRIARNLYIDNPFRLIFDTRGPTVGIDARQADDGVLDLSLSTLRSVSPVHIEYLGNMGVRSSASFPLLVMGRLWGLLAMHSPAPRAIPIDARLEVVRLVEQGLARRIMDAHVRENHRRFNASVERLERSAAFLAERRRDREAVPALPPFLADLIACRTLIIRVDGRALAPTGDLGEEEVEALADLGAREATRGLFLTDGVHRHLEQDEDFRRRVSGLLYATLGPARAAGHLELLWVREEQASTVTWAGRPEKVSAVVDGEERISPRKSFQAWSSETRGASAPWSSSDQLLVSKLLVQLIGLERGTGASPG